jgi:hypothetical protein
MVALMLVNVGASKTRAQTLRKIISKTVRTRKTHLRASNRTDMGVERNKERLSTDNL